MVKNETFRKNCRRKGEIGYWMSRDFGGNGLMSEAVCMLDRTLFTHHDLNRVYIKCDSENIASSKVAEKARYKLDGILRGDEFVESTQEFRDTHIYSKLKSEI